VRYRQIALLLHSDNFILYDTDRITLPAFTALLATAVRFATYVGSNCRFRQVKTVASPFVALERPGNLPMLPIEAA
jgi:hypothetical protein